MIKATQKGIDWLAHEINKPVSEDIDCCMVDLLQDVCNEVNPRHIRVNVDTVNRAFLEGFIEVV